MFYGDKYINEFMVELILFSVVIFLIVMLSLVMVLLFAKAKLSPSGDVSLTINGENTLKVSAGDTILTTLGNNKVFYLTQES